MRKYIKVMVLIILSITAVLFGIYRDILKGFILLVIAFVGMYEIEKVYVTKVIEEFEPLIFRCGRVEYVSKVIELTCDSLIYKRWLETRFDYMKLGILGVSGRYDEALNMASEIIIEGSMDELDSVKLNTFSKYDNLVRREICYNRLKLGFSGLEYKTSNEFRDELIDILKMIFDYNENPTKKNEIIQSLNQLREKETGNVIFREVNRLLSEQLMSIDREEAEYYAQIADIFYSDEQL